LKWRAWAAIIVCAAAVVVATRAEGPSSKQLQPEKFCRIEPKYDDTATAQKRRLITST
jgi:hypothetical protein